MIVFWAVAGMLAAGALLFVLPPLLRTRRAAQAASHDEVNVSIYRDQLRELDTDLQSGVLSRERYDEARGDIERRLLAESADAQINAAAAPLIPRSRSTVIAVALMVPALAVGLYLIVGNPEGLSPERTTANKPDMPDAQQFAAMVEKLALRLKDKPDDTEGWVMLGRSYTVLGRSADAAKAYETAVSRAPDNASLLADYAEAMSMAGNGQLQGEPEKIVQRAYAIDPKNVKVLALMGTVAFEKKDYAKAAALWEQMLPLVAPDSGEARTIQASIAEARAQAKGAGAALPAAAAEQPKTDSAIAQVSGVVQLAPELAKRIAPGDTVFIFARAAEGPRMPLAVLRKPAAELPLKFVLDDTLAMAPNMRLSSVKSVVVGARVSKAGNATPQSGDLEGATAPLAVGAKDITLVIDKVVP